MLVRDLPRRELARRLEREGIHLNTGAFTTHLFIDIPSLVDEFAELYADYPLEDPPGIDDATVQVTGGPWWRRLRGRMAYGSTDSSAVDPVPVERALTSMETALNWSAATSDVAPMVMHSAVLERHGRALILPAASGSGKSTLAAALAWRGWRLLSDEMAVFSFENASVLPNPRPVSLKNRSIDVVRAFDPRARISRLYRGTHKGDVAYMYAPADAIARAQEPARPALVITPLWHEGADTSVVRLERADAFRTLVSSTINYSALLRVGYDMMVAVTERCATYALTYSDLDSAIELIGRLHEDAIASGDRG